LLDAALDELRTRVWEDITMAEIATAAGVSRQTLYKEFGSRDEFAQALVLRESESFLAAVEGAILGHTDEPHVALRGAFEVFLEIAEQNPLLRSALTGQGAESLLPLVTTQGHPLLGFASERLSQIIADGWPTADIGDIQMLADVLVRLAISYATLPLGSAGETADRVAALLDPFIEQALADTGK
jgi:AcrR family transcriptional regulator